jgi:hypothetical protein
MMKHAFLMEARGGAGTGLSAEIRRNPAIEFLTHEIDTARRRDEVEDGIGVLPPQGGGCKSDDFRRFPINSNHFLKN